MDQTDLTRRRLFQGIGVAGLAAAPLLAACGDEDSGSSDTDEANDLKIVQAGRGREQEMVTQYTALLRVAPQEAKPLVQEILTQEQAHVTGLATVITDLGGKPTEAPNATGLAQVEPRSAFPGQLALVLGQEQTTVGTYIAETPKLTIGDLRATWTSLATSAAQHITVLEGLA